MSAECETPVTPIVLESAAFLLAEIGGEKLLPRHVRHTAELSNREGRSGAAGHTETARRITADKHC